MTLMELYDRLRTAIDHGANPEAQVLAFDPDSMRWEKVNVLVFSNDTILIHTDEP
jgi:hypothetical protein